MVVRRLVPWVLGVPLLVSSGLLLVLASRNRELSFEYQKVRELSTLPHAGTVVPTFRTVAVSGDSVIVGEAPDSATRQLIFVFNTSCPFCKATIPVWKALADSVTRLQRRVAVLAISLDSVSLTRRYVRTFDLRYLVITFPQRKLERLYRATAVPQTLVLNSAGTVLYAKTGLLQNGSVDSVYAAIVGRLGRN